MCYSSNVMSCRHYECIISETPHNPVAAAAASPPCPAFCHRYTSSTAPTFPMLSIAAHLCCCPSSCHLTSPKRRSSWDSSQPSVPATGAAEQQRPGWDHHRSSSSSSSSSRRMPDPMLLLKLLLLLLLPRTLTPMAAEGCRRGRASSAAACMTCSH